MSLEAGPRITCSCPGSIESTLLDRTTWKPIKATFPRTSCSPRSRRDSRGSRIFRIIQMRSTFRFLGIGSNDAGELSSSVDSSSPSGIPSMGSSIGVCCSLNRGVLCGIFGEAICSAVRRDRGGEAASSRGGLGCADICRPRRPISSRVQSASTGPASGTSRKGVEGKAVQRRLGEALCGAPPSPVSVSWWRWYLV